MGCGYDAGPGPARFIHMGDLEFEKFFVLFSYGPQNHLRFIYLILMLTYYFLWCRLNFRSLFTAYLLMVALIWPVLALEDNGFIPWPVIFLKALPNARVQVREILSGKIDVVRVAGCQESKNTPLTPETRATGSSLIWVWLRPWGLWSLDVVSSKVARKNWKCRPHFALPRSDIKRLTSGKMKRMGINGRG